jgi:hypothetical protein
VRLDISYPQYPFHRLLPSCSAAWGEGVPAVRIGQLVDAFGDTGRFESMCSPEFGQAMGQLGDTLVNTVLGCRFEAQ